MDRGAADRRPAAPGFTLIELLAVMLILGLLAAVALPNLGLRGSREVRDHAVLLAASLEFARERAVMTGIPHRLMLDLDQRAWWLEWEPPATPTHAVPAAAPGPRRWAEKRQLPLAAPASAHARPFEPLPRPYGAPHVFPDAVRFVEVESGKGSIREGRTWIRFDPDGSARATRVLLEDPEGRQVLLEVAPLAQAIRITHAGIAHEGVLHEAG